MKAKVRKSKFAEPRRAMKEGGYTIRNSSRDPTLLTGFTAKGLSPIRLDHLRTNSWPSKLLEKLVARISENGRTFNYAPQGAFGGWFPEIFSERSQLGTLRSAASSSCL